MTFNAVRRIEGNLADAFEVFTAATPGAKYAHATALLDGNEQRKELSAQYLHRFWTEVDSNNYVAAPLQSYGVYFADAPSGMLGLLAASVISHTGRPTIVAHRPEDLSSSTAAPRGRPAESRPEPGRDPSACTARLP